MENNEKKLTCADNVGTNETSAHTDDTPSSVEPCDIADKVPDANCVSDVIERALTDAERQSNDADLNIDDEHILHADGSFDLNEYFSESDQPTKPLSNRHVRSVFDFIEMLALVTVSIILCFSFVFRLNIVEGPSMEDTLHTGEYLIVSDLFYDPKPGDIVVIHDLTKESYSEPIVKRVIATAGQTVDIDFTTWTLTVDGEVVDESLYRKLSDRLLTSTVEFPLTVDENKIFVMGDNRNHSADSRISEIGLIDVRSVVGKVYARIFPFDKFTIFKNPYND